MTFSQPFPQGSGDNQPGNSAGTALVPPKFVNYAFYLFLLVALTQLILIIFGIVSLGSITQQAKDAADRVGNSALSASQLETAIRVGAIVGIVVSVLFVIAFVLFDYFMHRGAGWARIVLLILTILSLSNVTGGYGVGALGVVAGIVATILMFLRPASDFFRAVRDRKRGALGGGYPGPDQQYPGPGQTPPVQ